MADRTAEIWSTRLQREVLALTSIPEADDGKEATVEEDKESSDDLSHSTPKHDNLNIATLPPFVKLDSHELDVVQGICKITFSILVDAPKEDVKETAEEKEGDIADGVIEATDASKETEKAQRSAPGQPTVFVTLDASMVTVGGSRTVYYPFQKPLVILTAGEELFPPKSNIHNDDLIDLDCDWTPSLHLSDAILNVALKIRESIRRGDPFMAAAESSSPSSSILSPVDEISSTVSSFLGSLGRRKANKEQPKQKAPPSPKKRAPHPSQVKMGDVIDLSQPPYSNCAGMFSCKAIRRPEFVERAIAEAAAQDAEAAAKKAAAQIAQEDAEDNDIASGPGNYMKLHAGGIRKVAASGFMGASSFFKSIEKSIVQSTKSVLEEHFLMVTEEHIIEIRSSKLNLDSATVTFIAPVSLLAKLKFRREESISLFFRQSLEDPLIYMCPESSEAVQAIQGVLKRHGVKGKHTTTAAQRQIQAALQLVNLIRENELALEQEPSVEKVNEIMDLYRQAAEKFESANDPRHEEVVSHMQKFLAKPLTHSILDGSYEANQKAVEAIPAATIVSLPDKKDIVHDDDDDDGLAKEEAKLAAAGAATATAAQPTSKPVDTAYEETLKQVDDMMKEVESLSTNLDDDLNDFMNTASVSVADSHANDDDHDAVAELDAMLSAADKELNDLLESS